MTPEQFERLPKYARQHIKRLERERDRANHALEQFLDEQTPSNCRVEEYGVGVRYVQGDVVYINHLGVELSVTRRGSHEGLFLSWGAETAYNIGDICFTPTGHQQARLKNLAYHPDDFQRLLRDKAAREKAAAKDCLPDVAETYADNAAE